MKTKLFLTGLAMMAATTMMSAQNSNGNGKCKGQCKGSAYVDKNNDGVCDNYTANKGNVSGKCDGTGKGKGKCDGTGKGQGKGQNKK